MWIRMLATLSLTACASSQEPAVGVSTAPRSIPAARLDGPDAAPAPAPELDAGTALAPVPVARGRLHPLTGMSTGARKLDVKVLIARIEKHPDVLDGCSLQASAEPTAPDGSWNVRLAVKSGSATLRVESPVAPDFEQCLEAAAKQLALQGLADGEMMLLLGLQR